MFSHKYNEGGYVARDLDCDIVVNKVWNLVIIWGSFSEYYHAKIYEPFISPRMDEFVQLLFFYKNGFGVK